MAEMISFRTLVSRAAMLCVLLGCSSTANGGEAADNAFDLAPSPACPDGPTSPIAGGLSFFERPQTLASIREQSANSPQVILLTRDPWNAVVGSDSPAFALYEDGTAIYARDDKYAVGQLSEEEHREFLLAVESADDPRGTRRYEIASATDQSDNYLLLYIGEEPIFISVYGSLSNPGIVSCLPAELGDLLSDLAAFHHPEAKRWVPERVELMLTPYDYAPERSIQWPERWPDLYDSDTLNRGDSYSIFLPGDELDDLERFLQRRSARGAVEINGRKWSPAIRYPFPHEELWMPPNPEASNPG